MDISSNYDSKSIDFLTLETVSLMEIPPMA